MAEGLEAMVGDSEKSIRSVDIGEERGWLVLERELTRKKALS